MAHHRLASDSAAIFSPSVARQAASTARDWSYIDSWLATKLPNSPPPSFERNPDTLRVLLALASHCETSDEERSLLLKAESAALTDLQQQQQNNQENHNNHTSSTDLQSALLSAIEDELPHEGLVALNAMANAALTANIALPTPEPLAHSILTLHSSLHRTEQMRARVGVLQRHIDRDADRTASLLQHISTSDLYRPPSDMAKQNLDVQRKIKAMAAQLPDMQARVTALASSVGGTGQQPKISIEMVVREEEEYLALMARKKELDRQMAAFAGLPSDVEMARYEVNALRERLRGANQDLDAVFEGLVERESPMRRRRNSRFD